MTFKPKIWFPIAAGLALINVGAVWFAAVPGEAMHATSHAVLGVLFTIWAMRLRTRRALELGDPAMRVEQLEGEVDELRGQLSETLERLDFAERIMAQQRQAEPLPRTDRPAE